MQLVLVRGTRAQKTRAEVINLGKTVAPEGAAVRVLVLSEPDLAFRWRDLLLVPQDHSQKS